MVDSGLPIVSHHSHTATQPRSPRSVRAAQPQALTFSALSHTFDLPPIVQLVQPFATAHYQKYAYVQVQSTYLICLTCIEYMSTLVETQCTLYLPFVLVWLSSSPSLSTFLSTLGSPLLPSGTPATNRYSYHPYRPYQSLPSCPSHCIGSCRSNKNQPIV